MGKKRIKPPKEQEESWESDEVLKCIHAWQVHGFYQLTFRKVEGSAELWFFSPSYSYYCYCYWILPAADLFSLKETPNFIRNLLFSWQSVTFLSSQLKIIVDAWWLTSWYWYSFIWWIITHWAPTGPRESLTVLLATCSLLGKQWPNEANKNVTDLLIFLWVLDSWKGIVFPKWD